MSTAMEEIEKRVDEIKTIDQLKEELKLMWRLIYPNYVASKK